MTTHQEPPRSFTGIMPSPNGQIFHTREDAERLLKQITDEQSGDRRTVSDGMLYLLRKAWIEDSQFQPGTSQVMVEYEIDRPAKWADLSSSQQDQVIAEKVFGPQLSQTGDDIIADMKKYLSRSASPRYTTSMDAAWKLVEHLRVRFDVHVGSAPMQYDVAIMDRNSAGVNFTASAASAPEAICLAVLKAVGYQIEE